MAKGEYYYMKLKQDFFSQLKIKHLKIQPSSHKLINVLLMLYLLSLNSEGKLQVTDSLPMSLADLAENTGTDIKYMTKALKEYMDAGLIDSVDGCYHVTAIDTIVGRSSVEAENKADYRSKTKNKTETHAYGIHNNVMLTNAEYDGLINDYPNQATDYINKYSNEIKDSNMPESLPHEMRIRARILHDLEDGQ